MSCQITVRRLRSIDWIGITLLCTFIGSMQYVIDRGNSADWFASGEIQFITYICITSFLGFILHQFGEPRDRIFDIKIFKDKNFTIASFMLCIIGLGLYGTMVLQPLLMQTLLNYPVLTTGLLLAPRGIAGMVSMIVVTRLVKFMEPRWIILCGIIICTFGIYVTTVYSKQINSWWLMWPMVVQGFGMGLIFVPLSTIAFSTLEPHLRTEAAGMYSLLRTIGSSIGISIAITIFSRRSQIFWNELGGSITVYNPAVYEFLKPFHVSPVSPLGSALLSSQLAQESSMLAFVNAYAFIALAFIIMAPLVFALDNVKKA